MFVPNSAFSWTRELEENYTAIRAEYEALDPTHLRPWPDVELYNHGWEVFGLYGFGDRLDANCALCPRLARILETIEGLTTAGFSVLGPGAALKPHHGYTSTVFRAHLGIIVPEPDKCGLRVADETRTWREGECMVFDDTVEHEAWNRGEQARVVLLLDVVKPGATFESNTVPRGAFLRYFGVR